MHTILQDIPSDRKHFFRSFLLDGKQKFRSLLLDRNLENERAKKDLHFFEEVF